MEKRVQIQVSKDVHLAIKQIQKRLEAKTLDDGLRGFIMDHDPETMKKAENAAALIEQAEAIMEEQDS